MGECASREKLEEHQQYINEQYDKHLKEHVDKAHA